MQFYVGNFGSAVSWSAADCQWWLGIARSDWIKLPHRKHSWGLWLFPMQTAVSSSYSIASSIVSSAKISYRAKIWISRHLLIWSFYLQWQIATKKGHRVPLDLQTDSKRRNKPSEKSAKTWKVLKCYPTLLLFSSQCVAACSWITLRLDEN